MVLLLALTFAVSALLPFALRPVLIRIGVLDIPNDRSSHSVPAVRGVGLTVWFAMALAMTLAVLTGVVAVNRALIVLVTLIFTAAAILGWFEDYRGVSVRVRAAWQLAIGAVGTAALAVALGQPLWWVPAGALAIAVYINVANFMDGINGISGLHAVTVGAFYGIAGYLSDQFWLTVAGLILAVAFAGFLPWNLSRRPMFLGDVGSYLLGGSIAAIATAGFLAGVYVNYLLSPLIIYLADTAYTWLKRVRAGQTWYLPHREHVYQRLTDVGLSHLGSALVVTACTIALSLLGLLSASDSLTISVVTAIAGIVVVVGYLASPWLIERFRLRRGESGASAASAMAHEPSKRNAR